MAEAADMAKDFINVPKDQATPTTSFIGTAILLIFMYLTMGFVSDSYKAKLGTFRKKLKWPIFAIFWVIILALQFGVNLSATASKCGSPQIGYALWYTLFPNLIYTGVVILLLKLFPGFKSVFSNTIGYLIVGLGFVRGGIKKAFNKLLLPPSNTDLIKKVYTDESELVNLMTPNIYDFFKRIEDFSKLFPAGTVIIEPDKEAARKSKGKIKRNIISPNSPAVKDGRIQKLYSLILIKDYIGEFMWLFLTTMVVTATSFNFIQNINNCNKDDATRNMQSAVNKMGEVKKKAEPVAKEAVQIIK